jgi:regulatory protein
MEIVPTGGSAEPSASIAGNPNPEQEAFERAAGALAQRERTVGEMTGWLAQRGFERQVVDAVVVRLIEIGELDDECFARRYAEDKRELRGWGATRIREALIARGVDRDLIDAAVSGEEAGTELRRAAELVTRRRDDLSDAAGRARALAFLARRGYDCDIAYEAVRLAERESRAA